jgi:hypothetical protein
VDAFEAAFAVLVAFAVLAAFADRVAFAVFETLAVVGRLPVGVTGTHGSQEGCESNRGASGM